jgi:cell division protein ZapA
METSAKSINVMIAGRSYPLKIRESDETAIKEIAEEVNEKIKKFQLTYKNKDKQDCLSMALLTYAVDLYKLTKSNPDDHNLKKINELDRLLESALS